ncbi:uncharacterized protein LOC143888617 [Tasmannia lanceolata]|uniref:uncharacterized protein LOC143888617 n=1 Tax=Tasmannia lanceolata TaxID=3420 RepID=UPI0040628022
MGSLQLPIPQLVWEDVSMDFITGLPLSNGFTGIFVVIDRLSKYAHLGALPTTYNAVRVAKLLTKSIVSDRDPIFISNFWSSLFKLSGTSLKLSSAYHPQTDGQSEAVDTELTQRDELLNRLKLHLQQAQSRMKCLADQKRTDKQFEVGSWVLPKLQPYRQQSVENRVSQKLSKRFYGPYEIEGKIGKVAYKLKLPEGSKIHPVFHISLLKPFLGPLPQSVCTLPVQSFNNKPLISPLAIIGVRTSLKGDIPVEQVLIQWNGLLPEDTSWEGLQDLQQEYPHLNLEDKVNFDGVGIDRTSELQGTKEPDSSIGMEEIENMAEDEAQPEWENCNREKRLRRKPNWMDDYIQH